MTTLVSKYLEGKKRNSSLRSPTHKRLFLSGFSLILNYMEHNVFEKHSSHKNKYEQLNSDSVWRKLEM